MQNIMYVINGSRTHPEYLTELPKKSLMRYAKEIKLTGISRMNKRGLSELILQTLVQNEGNYITDMDDIEKLAITE